MKHTKLNIIKFNGNMFSGFPNVTYGRTDTNMAKLAGTSSQVSVLKMPRMCVVVHTVVVRK
jgi:hypothetical protein